MLFRSGGQKIYIRKRPGEPEITHSDIAKAKKMLNWSPQVSFEAGVAKMIESISDWNDAPLWDESSIELATQNWFKYLST